MVLQKHDVDAGHISQELAAGSDPEGMSGRPIVNNVPVQSEDIKEGCENGRRCESSARQRVPYGNLGQMDRDVWK